MSPSKRRPPAPATPPNSDEYPEDDETTFSRNHPEPPATGSPKALDFARTCRRAPSSRESQGRRYGGKAKAKAEARVRESTDAGDTAGDRGSWQTCDDDEVEGDGGDGAGIAVDEDDGRGRRVVVDGRASSGGRTVQASGEAGGETGRGVGDSVAVGEDVSEVEMLEVLRDGPPPSPKKRKKRRLGWCSVCFVC